MNKTETILAFAKFGAWAYKELRCPVGGNLYGGEAQEKLLELGLLQLITVSEYCGNNCECDIGDECLKPSSHVKCIMKELEETK